jgi:hypothetical protein
MTDLVALIVGIAHYPDLPDEWHVPGDRTAGDAIAVTRALRARGVEANKIKLLLSAKGAVPDDVDGVRPEAANLDVLKKFIGKQLGRESFAGSRFFLFCSGHGASAVTHADTLIVTPDSYATNPNHRMFSCFGVDRLRIHLQGQGFTDQLFCINACRTPIEWTAVGKDQLDEAVFPTLDRAGPIRQSRFFSADELEPAPVETGADFSNGFARAVVRCIERGDWPPRDSQWARLLHLGWRRTRSFLPGPDPMLFQSLLERIVDLDRERQFDLANDAFALALSWNQSVGDDDDAKANLWQTTLIDLHARTTDCLNYLLDRLEMRVFKKTLVDRVRRAASWPDRAWDPARREKELIKELTYCLAGNRNLTDPAAIIKAVAGIRGGARVVYVEVDGPCQHNDEGLIRAMVQFWKKIIAAAVASGTEVPRLPLLLVGHVDCEERPKAGAPIEVTQFYHGEELAPGHERRLNLVAGGHLRDWLADVVATEGDRSELEREIARELGGFQFVDIAGVPMGQVVDVFRGRAQ